MTTAAPPDSWEFRRQTIACTEGLLRILHALLETYDDDLESSLVYLAVCCASVGGALRSPRPAADAPPEPVELRHFRTVSRRAIAASTGLPRETVRRKIAVFLERGSLVAERGGVRIRQGLFDESRNREFARTMIREFARVGAQIDASS